MSICKFITFVAVLALVGVRRRRRRRRRRFEPNPYTLPVGNA